MEVIFKDADGSMLGHAKYNDLAETLIPAFYPDKHDMFLKYVFESKSTIKHWKITDLLVNGSVATIHLEKAESCQSLVDFATGQNKNLNPESYLTPYHIVEVDFGFYTDMLKSNGQRLENKENTDSLLRGEMHKRRPCVVLGASSGCVQIIPLSTKKNLEHNPKCIALSPESFSRLAPRYTAKKSYALLERVQTVSINRIFPPKAKNNKYEHNYQFYSISATDKDSLKKALAGQYNRGLEIQNKTLESRLLRLQQEKSRLLTSKGALYAANMLLQTECETLKKLISRLGEDAGVGKTVEDVSDYYKGRP